MRFSNINSALRGLIARWIDEARTVEARGSETREIGPIQFTIEQPRQRCLVLPQRNNNVFASIAETMWVLAGRNDIAFLEHYLPRARDFSDDGLTWRAGYGPRLRDWHGVDQIDEVRKLLVRDPLTRRAVTTIYDPSVDFADSLDIPCNNWLHFVQRDGALNAHVAVRSNDIMWGFSGINAFEWSVLLEMLAHWSGAVVGTLTFSVTSSHIYERHYDRARRIVDITSPDADLYMEKDLRTFAFATAWEDFAGLLDQWFSLEQDIRAGRPDVQRIDGFPDPLLGAFLRMMAIYWALEGGRPTSEVRELMAPLDGSDLGEAAAEYVARKRGDFPAYIYSSQATPDTPAVSPDLAEAPSAAGVVPSLGPTISSLHALKTSAYGDSWKRRGELIGIMANIARKVDRLQVVDGRSPDDDETALDTAIDLLVYSLKYSTYLMDRGERVPLEQLRAQRGTLSDGCAGFDAVLADVLAAPLHWKTGVSAATRDVRERYEDLEQAVQGAGAAPRHNAKAAALDGLVVAALSLVIALVDAMPSTYADLEARMNGYEASRTSDTAATAQRGLSEQAKYFAEHNATRRFSYE